MVPARTALAPVLQRGEFIETAPLPGSHVFSANLPIFVVQYMTGIGSPGRSRAIRRWETWFPPSST